MEGLLWNAASRACMQQLVVPSVSIRKNRYADFSTYCLFSEGIAQRQEGWDIFTRMNGEFYKLPGIYSK